MDENEDPVIPEKVDKPLSNVSVTSKMKTKNNYKNADWRKIDLDIPEDTDFKPATINLNLDILRATYDYFKCFVNDEMLSKMAYQRSLSTT